MVNKKIEVTLQGKTYPVWFNLYSKIELLTIYGTDDKGIFDAISKRQAESPLLLFGDILKAGLKGAALAKNETTPEIANNINEAIATMDESEMVRAWAVLFGSFKEHMGMNVKQTEPKKKAVKKKK